MVNIFLVGDFDFTCKTLDPRRKFKQAVESRQIISILTDETKQGFKNHPAVAMWRPYLGALKLYYNTFIRELKKDGFKIQKMEEFTDNEPVVMPWFIDFMPLIYSHRARLYQKDPFYYKDKFTFPDEYLNIGYIWTNRHDKEFYLDYNYNVKDIADPLNIIYKDVKYCQKLLKSGKRKGEPCNNIIKNKTDDFCGVHMR